jgi:putative redox protein
MGKQRVVLEEGDRFRLQMGDHDVVVDQPFSAGGTDAGPTPTDLFVASVAACSAFYAGRFLRRHGIDPAGLEVGYTFRMGRRPARVEAVDLELRTPPLPEGMDQRLRAVVEHCTVTNSLANPPAIDLELRTLARSS